MRLGSGHVVVSSAECFVQSDGSCYVLVMMPVLASSTTEIMLSHITPQQGQVVDTYPRYVRDPQLSGHLPQLTHLMPKPQTGAAKTWSFDWPVHDKKSMHVSKSLVFPNNALIHETQNRDDPKSTE